jgi:H+/Cl- antiporter ClcA
MASQASGVAPELVPATLASPGAWRLWSAAVLIGLGAGLGAAGLTRLLEEVQRLTWSGDGRDILAEASRAGASRHIVALVSAGLLTGIGQVLLRRLTSANSIETTEAIWFRAGRFPRVRTLGSAVLSILIVGMGASLGREGAPKQTGAVLADALCDTFRLSDNERRLLVACGAGAGMAAAYGVPLGGALFALEVLRGALALRLVLPALLTSLIASGISWLFLPNTPVYAIPAYESSLSSDIWAVLIGPIAGIVSVLFVRAIALADRHKPTGPLRVIAPIITLGIIGVVSIPFPQLLGNGQDVSQLAFVGALGPMLLLALVFLRPLATVACLGSGAPGGLFTPSITLGAMLGGLFGRAWLLIWPGPPAGLFAVLGAAAVLAATTQGPVSAIILIMELTGRDRTFILPLMLAVISATLVARTVEARSIYEARLSDEQVAARLRMREGLTASATGAG